MKIAFITDSGTGMSSALWKQEGIYSLPLQINDGDENFYDLEDITIEQVYERLRAGHILSTSLPSLGKIEALFQELMRAMIRFLRSLSVKGCQVP